MPSKKKCAHEENKYHTLFLLRYRKYKETRIRMSLDLLYELQIVFLRNFNPTTVSSPF